MRFSMVRGRPPSLQFESLCLHHPTANEWRSLSTIEAITGPYHTTGPPDRPTLAAAQSVTEAHAAGVGVRN